MTSDGASRELIAPGPCDPAHGRLGLRLLFLNPCSGHAALPFLRVVAAWWLTPFWQTNLVRFKRRISWDTTSSSAAAPS